MGFFPAAVVAQATGQAASGSVATSEGRGVGSIQLGPVAAYPGLDFRAGYNDNLHLTNTNQVSSPITIISPYVKLETKAGGNVFDVLYRGNFATYQNSRADDYSDELLQANAQIRFNVRNDLQLRLEGRTASDPRGSTDRAFSPAPDEWRQTTLYAKYGYGAAGAPGRLEFDASSSTRRYTNNRDTTAAFDTNFVDFGAAFFWRLAPRTRVFIQARYSLIDYLQASSTQSSSETRYFVGAQWEATAKTTGYAKVGMMEKSFKSGGLASQSDLTWDVGVRWSPLSYSVFDVSTLKTFKESTGVGDAVQSTSTNVFWTHAWDSRLNHTVYWSRISDDFLAATRKDEANTLGLKVNYQMRRWLRLGAEFAHTQRDSNDSQFQYRRNLLLFTVGGTL